MGAGGGSPGGVVSLSVRHGIAPLYTPICCVSVEVYVAQCMLCDAIYRYSY